VFRADVVADGDAAHHAPDIKRRFGHARRMLAILASGSFELDLFDRLGRARVQVLLSKRMGNDVDIVFHPVPIDKLFEFPFLQNRIGGG